MQRRPYLGMILITIIIIVIGVFVVRGIFGRSNTAQQANNVPSNTLVDNGRQITYTVYGSLVAEEDRRAIRITISDSMRKLEVLRGYDEAVISSKLYSNKSSAFDALVVALDAAGYTLRDTSITRDERGVCPDGRTFIYETKYDDDSTIRTWSTSCSTKNTSFKGDADVVRRLFQDQIPDYRDLTRDVEL